MEQEVAAGSRDGQVSELVQDDEVAAAQGVGKAPLAPVAVLAFQKVGQLDDVEEAAPGAFADAGTRHRHREMRLSGSGPAHEDAVPVALDEVAPGEPPHRRLVDRAGREVELRQLLGVGQPGDRKLALDRPGRLVGHLGLQKRAENPVGPALLPAPGLESLVIRGLHAPQAEGRHQGQDLAALHPRLPSRSS